MENYLSNQKRNKLSENRIKKFVLEILLGMDYLHE